MLFRAVPWTSSFCPTFPLGCPVRQIHVELLPAVSRDHQITDHTILTSLLTQQSRHKNQKYPRHSLLLSLCSSQFVLRSIAHIRSCSNHAIVQPPRGFRGSSSFVVTDPAASSSASLEAFRGSTEVEHVTNPAETHLINGMQEDRGKSFPILLSEGLDKLAKWTGLKGESSKNKGVASVDEALDDEAMASIKEMLEKVYNFGQAFNIVGKKEVALSRDSGVIASPYSHTSLSEVASCWPYTNIARHLEIRSRIERSFHSWVESQHRKRWQSFCVRRDDMGGMKVSGVRWRKVSLLTGGARKKRRMR